MPGKLKMKWARLAVGHSKDNYWSHLPETIFGQKFSSARNQTLFFDPCSAVSTKFFNLLYSISKIASPRYSRVSYKILNGWAEAGHWLAANFTLPAVTWKNIFLSFSMLLWCIKHLPGQSANIDYFEFFAVLPVWLFSTPLDFFFLRKGQMKFDFLAFLGRLDFLCRFGRFTNDFIRFLGTGRFLDTVYGHRMIYFYRNLCTRIYNFLFCCFVHC